MKNWIFSFMFALCLGSPVMAETVFKCVDGTRSMTVFKQNGKLVGKLIDFNLTLNDMTCARIPNTKTVRCDSNDYYVVVFKIGSSKRVTAQLNLKDDFYSDSGYLHSLYCK